MAHLPDLACRMLDAAILAYDIVPDTASPPGPDLHPMGTYRDNPALRARIGLPDIPDWFADGPRTINAGFVGVTSDGWIVLSLRGTLPPGDGPFLTWVEDWLNDFRAGPVPWYLDPSHHNTKIGHVEHGFADASRSLWHLAGPALEAAIRRTPGARGILVAGHSKGAAMCFPVGSLVAAAHPGLLKGVHAYATPMTCDRDFAAWWQGAGLDALTMRYQNRDDLVPFLPWWPTLGLAGRIGEAAGIDASRLRDDYVRIGALTYLGGKGNDCQPITDPATDIGGPAWTAAVAAIESALEHADFRAIIDAHSASGRYHRCICAAAPAA